MQKIIYEKGTKIGYWTVGEEVKKNGKRYYHCVCKCGAEKDVLSSQLNCNKSLSCGCMAKIGKGRDLTGQKIGDLTVEQKIIIGNHTFFKCKCACGNEKLLATNQIMFSKSCGCKEGIGDRIKKSLEPYCKNGTYIPGLTRTTLNKNNTSGYKGVSWREERGKYRAYIKFRRKNIHLGNYDTLEAAVEARKIGEKVVLEWAMEEN